MTPKQPLLFSRETRPGAGATISKCGRYRYLLWRYWDDRPPLTWLMLNPSTADGFADDPTIRRCKSFSKGFGYGGVRIVNLFGWRSKDPKDLVDLYEVGFYDQIVGPNNDRAILSAASMSDRLVVGWGAHGKRWGERIAAVQMLLGGVDMYCLGRTQSGEPRHPLMVRTETRMRAWP